MLHFIVKYLLYIFILIIYIYFSIHLYIVNFKKEKCGEEKLDSSAFVCFFLVVQAVIICILIQGGGVGVGGWRLWNNRQDDSIWK